MKFCISSITHNERGTQITDDRSNAFLLDRSSVTEGLREGQEVKILGMHRNRQGLKEGECYVTHWEPIPVSVTTGAVATSE